MWAQPFPGTLELPQVRSAHRRTGGPWTGPGSLVEVLQARVKQVAWNGRIMQFDASVGDANGVNVSQRAHAWSSRNGRSRMFTSP
eukprot:CAMPEP_0195147808 /NCGR_PEP_ID=MMETSP0448-20130528/174095_1 /TAXON_ID=66468 /ORGANISM="Heterocapsa triquestra, Strain CCMP 448" /LENGTH=84 /DNA_ID=CAMNT_0040186399 /DNA_START=52 /DNA_END=306 /DNA_ORIENTATION=+